MHTKNQTNQTISCDIESVGGGGANKPLVNSFSLKTSKTLQKSDNFSIVSLPRNDEVVSNDEMAESQADSIVSLRSLQAEAIQRQINPKKVEVEAVTTSLSVDCHESANADSRNDKVVSNGEVANIKTFNLTSCVRTASVSVVLATLLATNAAATWSGGGVTTSGNNGIVSGSITGQITTNSDSGLLLISGGASISNGTVPSNSAVISAEGAVLNKINIVGITNGGNLVHSGVVFYISNSIVNQFTNNSVIQGGINAIEINNSTMNNITFASGSNISASSSAAIAVSVRSGEVGRFSVGGSVIGNLLFANTNITTHLLLGNATMNGNIRFLGSSSNVQKLSIESSSAITGDIIIDENTKVTTLEIKNSNLTGNISLNISSGGNSYIETLNFDNGVSGGIIVGNSGSVGNGTITNLTLKGTSSVGSIVNNATGTIQNLTLNSTAAQAITGALSNAGTINTLTLNANNNIGGGIANGGVIKTLDVKNNVAYDSYNSVVGKIQQVLNVGSGIALDNKNKANVVLDNDTSSTGSTITNAGTITGNLENQGTITQWNGTGTIEGDFINKGLFEIGVGGTILGGLKNEGGTIENAKSSEYGNGSIQNDGIIRNLVVDSTGAKYSGNGAVSESVEVQRGQDLTIQNGTLLINSKAENSANATGASFTNAGNITGNLQNVADSVISSFTNSSRIVGHFENLGTIKSFENRANSFIQELTAGNLENGLVNAGSIGTLNVTEDLIYKNNGKITTALNVSDDKTMRVESGTLIIDSGMNNKTTIDNKGTIEGNLKNEANSVVSGLLAGNITGSLENAGTIEGLRVNKDLTYTQGANGIISNSLTIENGADTQTRLEIKDSNGNVGKLTLTMSGADKNVNNTGIVIGNLQNVGGNGIDDFTNSGTLEGNLQNVSGAIITGFTNSGEIAGHLWNQGEIGNLTNTADGVIDRVTAGNITGSLQNLGNIGTLEISEDIRYSGSGIINDLLQIDSNKKLNVGNGINLKGDGFHLSNEGDIVGNVTNSGTIKQWGGAGQIQGNFINTGSVEAEITTSGAGHITGSLQNRGVIDKLHSSVITNNNGDDIVNKNVIKELVIDSDTQYSGNGSVSESISVQNSHTLTIGSGTLNIKGQNVSFSNSGSISGNLQNVADSVIGSFTNSGRLQGHLQNLGKIESFKNEVSGFIEQITAGNITGSLENLGNVGSLNVNANLTYAGSGSISNSLRVDSNKTLTIGNGKGTLTINSGAGGTGANVSVNNGGIIAGNLQNVASSNIANFTNSGKIAGHLDNKGQIGNLVNQTGGVIDRVTAGNITGILQNQGDIGSLVVNEDITYAGNGSISDSLEVQQGDTLTIGQGGQGTLTINGQGVEVNNQGSIAGNLTNIKDSIISNFTNSGGINGTLRNEGIITAFENTGSILQFDNLNAIHSFKNTGTITHFNNELGSIKGIINDGSSSGGLLENGIVNNGGHIYDTIQNINKGVIKGGITNVDKSEITSILNGENSTIEGGITNEQNASIGNITNSGTITGGITNSGIISGNVVNKEGGSVDEITAGNIAGSLQNQGNIGSLNVNGAIQGGLENRGAIGSLQVNTDVNYSGSGSISNSLQVGNHTLNIGGNGSLILNGSSVSVNNSGIIAGTLQNRGTITSFENKNNISAIIAGNITGSLQNSGTIGSLVVDKEITQGVKNDKVIGNLSVKNDVSYTGGGSISNSLSVDKDKTLTAAGGIVLDSTQGTLNNAGTIAGNLTNQGTIAHWSGAGTITGNVANNGVINAITGGNITGSLENAGTIGALATSVVDEVVNDRIIGSLRVDSSATYSGSGSIRDSLIVDSGDTLTIGGGNGSLILNGSNAGVSNAGSITGTLQNQGTINNLVNIGKVDAITAGNVTGTFGNSGSITNLDVNGSIGKLVNVGENAEIGSLVLNGSAGSFSNSNGAEIGSLEVNHAGNTIENDSSIGELRVNVDFTYREYQNGGIADSLVMADKAVLSGNQITLNGATSSVQNLGEILATLVNKSQNFSLDNQGLISVFSNEGSIVSFQNSGSILGVANAGIIEGDVSGLVGALENTNKGVVKGNVNLGGITQNGESFIANQGTITGGIINDSGHKLDSVANGNLIGGNVKNDGAIGTLFNSGNITGSVENSGSGNIDAFANAGTMGDLQNDGHIGTLQNSGDMGAITNTSMQTIKEFINAGQMHEGINNSGRIDELVNAGTIKKQILSTGSMGSIVNAGIINADFMQSGDLQAEANDAIRINQSDSITLHNEGTIRGNVRVSGSSEIGLSNNKVIAGCVVLNGGRIELANAQGGAIECVKMSAKESGAVGNAGTISQNLTNDSGRLEVRNAEGGSIAGIITQNGGNTTIASNLGEIGGIANVGNSRTNITLWHFDDTENPSSPIRLDTSVTGSNLSGVKIDKMVIDAAITPGVVYDGSGFIVDKNGNTQYDSVGYEKEGFVESLEHIAEIFDFTDYGGGKYGVNVDRTELVGKTMAKSMIYSSRMRQISIGNMLREINVKNFQTDFDYLKEQKRQAKMREMAESRVVEESQGAQNALLSQNTQPAQNARATTYSAKAKDVGLYGDVEIENYYDDSAVSLDVRSEAVEFNAKDEEDLEIALLRELDDIFVKHKGNERFYSFVVPYTRYSNLGLGDGLGTLKANTAGVIAGIQGKLPSENGILGVFFGYETSDKQVGQSRLRSDDKAYYGGLTYYNIFARSGLSEYYVSAESRVEFSNSKSYKSYALSEGSDSTEVETYGYGASLRVGANYYNIYNNSVISPELGVNYQGISSKPFTMERRGVVREHYFAQDVNFFDVMASLRWQRAWNNVFKTTASLGGLYNVYNDAKGAGIIAGQKLTSEITTQELYGYANVGISYSIGENMNLFLDYNGIFADHIQSHTGYVRLGIWW